MLIPYSWLKDFVNLKKSTEEIAEALSLSSIGVKEVKKESGEKILNLDVTYNRGDLLSIAGVARELAAISDLNAEKINRVEEFNPLNERNLEPLKIKSRDDLAKIYTLTKISDLSPRSTPDLIKKRIEAAGMRSVNLWADLTNYVMLEYGQPFHAFDFEKVARRDPSLLIEVRKAKNGEAIKTLDGLDHRLSKSDIVIADGSGPIAIAGVMGSKDTEVDDGTKEILLEAAIFDSASIRQTARRLGLRSEASTRFEHFLSAKNLFISLNKIIQLFEQNGKGKVSSFTKLGQKEPAEVDSVVLTHEKLSSLAGELIPLVRAREYLERLGFKVMSSEKGLLCWPPYFRGDIKLPEDLVEEVLRIHGYERIVPKPIQTEILGSGEEKTEVWREPIVSIFSAYGFREVKNYPFVSTRALSHLKSGELLRLRNPISPEAEYLRPNLLFSILENASKNAPREKIGKIFELEKVYPKTGEVLHLGGLSWGEKEPFLNLKGVLEAIAKQAHLKLELSRSKNEFLHPTVSAELKIGKEILGFVGTLHPHLCDAFGLPQTAVFEIDFEKFSEWAQMWGTFKPVSSYPEVYEEFSFIFPQTRELGKLIEQIGSASEIIQDVELTDRFTKDEERSLTMKVIFQSQEKSLSAQDIKPVREKILSLIKKSGGSPRI